MRGHETWPVKPCPFCGRPMTPNRYHSLADHLDRVSCGAIKCRGRAIAKRKQEAAAAAMLALVETHAPCAICGRRFSPHIGEKTWNYRDRLTCSHRCAAALRGQMTKARFEAVAQLPRPVGEIDFRNGFAVHNLKLRPGGVVKMPRPDTAARSLTGSSAALLTQGRG